MGFKRTPQRLERRITSLRRRVHPGRLIRAVGPEMLMCIDNGPHFSLPSNLFHPERQALQSQGGLTASGAPVISCSGPKRYTPALVDENAGSAKRSRCLSKKPLDLRALADEVQGIRPRQFKASRSREPASSLRLQGRPRAIGDAGVELGYIYLKGSRPCGCS